MDRAAVQPDVLPGDREAQSAPRRPCARRVGLVEAVEDVREHGGVDARAAVLDLRHQPRRPVPLPGPQAYGDGLGPVPQCVADQVGDDHVEAARVERRPYTVLEFGTDAVVPVTGLKGLADGLGHVDLVAVEIDGPGVEPGDLHQVLDERGEFSGLRADQPDGRRGVGAQPGGVLVEHLGDGQHAGERGAQFVRHVRGEAPGPFLGLAELLDGLLELGRRLVERPGQFRDLVGAADRDPGVEFAPADAGCGAAQFTYRTQDAARGEQGGDQGDEQGGQGAVAGRGDHGGDVRLLGGERHHGIQDEAGGLAAVAAVEEGRHADGQPGLAVLHHPLERAVAVVPGRLPQSRRDHGGGRTVRGGDPQVPVLGEDGPGVRLAVAGKGEAQVPQPDRVRWEVDAPGADPVAELGDCGVLRLLQDRGAGLAVGQGRGGGGADRGDEQERGYEPGAEAEPGGEQLHPRGPKR